MKAIRVLAALSVCSLAFVFFSRAQGPIGTGTETVARPKNQSGSSNNTTNSTSPAPDTPAPVEQEQPKIPSDSVGPQYAGRREPYGQALAKCRRHFVLRLVNSAHRFIRGSKGAGV